MNKKKLSVVMAGAMLASSVAPVLAAEVTTTNKYEISADNLGLLQKGLRELFESKKFSNVVYNDTKAGESVYYAKKGTTIINLTNLEAQIKALKAGESITIYDEGHRVDEKGNILAFDSKDAVAEGKYTATRLESDANIINGALTSFPVIKAASYDETNEKLTITLFNGKELEYGVGDDIVAFGKPVSNGLEIENIADNAQLVDGFALSMKATSQDKVDIKNSVVAVVKITAGGNSLKVEDLYDGLMLTTKGHDVLSEIKEAKDYNFMDLTNNTAIGTASQITSDHGMYGFRINLVDAFGIHKTYTVTGTDKDDAETLFTWLISKAPKVDILAGDNRYETAVTIAKDVANIKSVINNKEIVLVNGDSLVDGLAAAPLAANYGVHTPILLTESNKLPAATKEYLKDLISQVPVGKLNEVNIKIVGGTSVVSKAVEKELKGYGFDVERFGGSNREETSLLVAEEIGKAKDAFVVGAEGEADAMSIAAYAASKKQPIIVAKKGGISEDALETLEDVKVTVIGGESVVSEKEYKEIKSVAKAVTRVSGSNRQATNAEIIARYYTNGFAGAAKNVVVAKDGQKNKSELIDALAATTLASKNNAPIVLATNKLSNAQINALELNASTANALYQVGHGVDRNVVKTIAERLNLVK